MHIPEVFQRLLLALAIGLLIGVERGWQDREGKPGSRAAGIRTHALIGLLGGVLALLARSLGVALLGFGFVGFAATFAFFEYREVRSGGSVSATGLIAAFLAFVLGAYAVLGDMAAAGGAAVAATVILAERRLLHSFLEKLQWSELRAALLLLVMTFVLLPVLPNRTIDPWQSLNPYQLWLMAIFIASLSYVGYISVRLGGGQRGLLFAGAAGALVSSTTVTWTFARLARKEPSLRRSISAAILLAWAISLLRVAVVGTFLSPPLLLPLGLPLAAGVSVAVAAAFVLYRGSAGDTDAKLSLGDPFNIGAVLQFTALLAIITLAATLIARTTGNGIGLPALAFASGLVDVDPITLSMARMASQTVYSYAALVILTATAANLLAKSCCTVIFGGWRTGMPLVLIGFLMAFVAGLAAMLMR